MKVRTKMAKGGPPKKKHILRHMKENCFFYLHVYYFVYRSANFALSPAVVVYERILTQCPSRIVLQRS